MGPLWDHFGTTLGPLFNYFGTILGQFWDHFGTTLGPFWDHFGTISGQFWDYYEDYFGTILDPSYFDLLLLKRGPKAPKRARRAPQPSAGARRKGAERPELLVAKKNCDFNIQLRIVSLFASISSNVAFKFQVNFLSLSTSFIGAKLEIPESFQVFYLYPIQDLFLHNLS